MCKEVFNMRVIVRKLNLSSKKGLPAVKMFCSNQLRRPTDKTTEANEIFIVAADFWRLLSQRLGSRARAPPLALIGADLTFA